MYADTIDRIDAGGDRRDRPPARGPGGVQRRARDRADDDRQGDPRHQRAAPRGGRVDRGLRRGLGRPADPAQLAATSHGQVERLVAQMEAEMKSAAKQLEFERAAALRDEIQRDPAARPRRGRRHPDRAGRRGCRPTQRDRRRRGRVAGADAAAEAGVEGRSERVRRVLRESARGHLGRGPAGRRRARRDPRPGERRRGARRGRGRDRVGLAARHPRRARRRWRLAGPLARSADLGSDGHPERHPPDRHPGTAPPSLRTTSAAGRMPVRRSRRGRSEATRPGWPPAARRGGARPSASRGRADWRGAR